MGSEIIEIQPSYKFDKNRIHEKGNKECQACVDGFPLPCLKPECIRGNHPARADGVRHVDIDWVDTYDDSSFPVWVSECDKCGHTGTGAVIHNDSRVVPEVYEGFYTDEELKRLCWTKVEIDNNITDKSEKLLGKRGLGWR